MYFKQFYLGCLAHASYLIGSNGEAVVVDPQRDVDQYIEEATSQNLKIKYIIETHLHADFVSGHCELASRTGAKIIFSHKAGATFPHQSVRDGDEISTGNLSLKILETPGHTIESISILITDKNSPETPAKILTGDTLFIGDVGRPDLVASKGYSAETMAGMLYDSLHEKLLTLDDNVEVYPAHGAGSLCGRNISKETSSTIGQQRRFNYALAQMSKDEFVKMMSSGLLEIPDYFVRDVEINKKGAIALIDLPKLVEFSPQEVSKLLQQGYTILDIRSAEKFGNGHIPGAINIGLDGQYASWVGTLFPIETPFIIIEDDKIKIDEAAMRLARVGIENVKGYLKMNSWEEAKFEKATLPQMSVNELHILTSNQSGLQIVDVRRPSEYVTGHVPGAINFQLSDLKNHVSELEPALKTAVICAGGYRSSIACSILIAHGFHNLINIIEGTSAWIKANLPIEKVAVAKT